jgi:hypothetical protein
MTGDPAWYDLAYIGKSFVPPRDIRTIVFSVPARGIYHRQSIELARGVRGLFPGAELLCTFHHGWEASSHVSPHVAATFSQLREAFDRCGFKTISLVGDLQRMESMYGDAELHIGYRLHAHLFFLSQRKVSFLMEEEGRGRGASEALGLRGIQAWSRRAALSVITKTPDIRFVRGILHRLLGHEVTSRETAANEMLSIIAEELEDGFPRFKGLGERLDYYYAKMMLPFLNSLPRGIPADEK